MFIFFYLELKGGAQEVPGVLAPVLGLGVLVEAYGY